METDLKLAVIAEVVVDTLDHAAQSPSDETALAALAFDWGMRPYFQAMPSPDGEMRLRPLPRA